MLQSTVPHVAAKTEVREDLESLRPTVANVLGLPIYVGTTASFCDFFCKNLDKLRGKSACIASPDIYNVIIAQRRPVHNEIFKKHFLCLPDGNPIAILARMRFSAARRCRGPDNMREVIRTTAPLGTKHFFLGATEDVLTILKEKAEKEWHNPHIVDTYAPPFVRDAAQYDYTAIAERITRSGAEVIWVALGTPKQHIFSARLAELVQVTAIFSVGAAFNFHSGHVSEAPRWIQRFPLPVEWIYRTYQEPRRLLPRYLYTLFWFPYYCLLDFITKGKKTL